jgi:lysophospholipase L1-like esterase
VTLEPASNLKEVFSLVTLTATVTETVPPFRPKKGVQVRFRFLPGSDDGAANLGYTGTDGKVSLSWMRCCSPLKETIVARVTDPATGAIVESNQATVSWKVPFVYYALGDSVASGHGLPEGGDDPEKNPCRRSKRSYAHKVAMTLAGQMRSGGRLEGYYLKPWFHAACSGARTYTGSEQPVVDLPQQVDRLLDQYKRSGTFIDRTLVTITAGIDDYGLSHNLLTGEQICQASWYDWQKQIAEAVQRNLIRQIRRIIKEIPDAIVVLTDYPNTLNKESHYFDLMREARASLPLPLVWSGADSPGFCRNFCRSSPYASCESNVDCFRGLSPDEYFGPCIHQWASDRVIYSRMQELLNYLNDSIRAVASRPEFAGNQGRIAFVSVHDLFEGREGELPNCGSAARRKPEENTLVQYPSSFSVADLVGADQACCWNCLLIDCPWVKYGKLGVLRGNDCVHPNEDGAQVIAHEVMKKVVELLTAP